MAAVVATQNRAIPAKGKPPGQRKHAPGKQSAFQAPEAWSDRPDQCTGPLPFSAPRRHNSADVAF